jgi:hypothetical protein
VARAVLYLSEKRAATDSLTPVIGDTFDIQDFEGHQAQLSLLQVD